MEIETEILTVNDNYEDNYNYNIMCTLTNDNKSLSSCQKECNVKDSMDGRLAAFYILKIGLKAISMILLFTSL